MVTNISEEQTMSIFTVGDVTKNALLKIVFHSVPFLCDFICPCISFLKIKSYHSSFLADMEMVRHEGEST